jgi:uncharacterized membrane protein YhaH (DUF805 family)
MDPWRKIYYQGMVCVATPFAVLGVVQIILGATHYHDTGCDPLDNGFGIQHYLLAEGCLCLCMVFVVVMIVALRGIWYCYYHDLSDWKFSSGVWCGLFLTQIACITYGSVVTFMSVPDCPQGLHTFSIVCLVGTYVLTVLVCCIISETHVAHYCKDGQSSICCCCPRGPPTEGEDTFTEFP